MMVGRDVVLHIEKRPATPGEVVLDIAHLQVADERGNIAVSDVSLQIHRGEIVGIAGVQGNGQTELVAAVTGLIQPLHGEL
jgi:simple sugar transport system ATP-binding protein